MMRLRVFAFVGGGAGKFARDLRIGFCLGHLVRVLFGVSCVGFGFLRDVFCAGGVVQRGVVQRGVAQVSAVQVVSCVGH